MFLYYCINLFAPTHFPFYTLCNRVNMDGPHLRHGELCFTSLRVKNLHQLLGNFLYEKFVYFTPLIYLLNHLIITLEFLGIYFILRIIMQYYFILSRFSSFNYWELFLLALCPFDILPSLFLLPQ